MTDATYKSGIRSMLDGSLAAIEAAIEDAVEDPADAPAIVDHLRQLITAERMLCDGEYRAPEMAGEDFWELVKKYRERSGR